MIFSIDEIGMSALELQLYASENGEDISFSDALNIVVQMQRTDVIARAFGVMRDGNISSPAFIERIAMELGAAESGDTIKSAIFELAQSVSNE